MHKITVICSFLLALSGQTWAMGNKVVQAGNELGLNDGAQQAAGDIGAGVANYGKKLVDDAYNFGNQGVSDSKVKEMANAGTKVFGYGKAVEYTGKAAPHVGWAATSAGRAAEGDYTGAAIEGVNGATRAVTVAKIGTAAGTAGGIWVAGKLGAMAGSWAGPLGAGAGFVIGCGAAYVGGKIWDHTIGAGAEALDQKVKDWNAERQYAGDRDLQRQNAQQIRENSPQRPTGGGSGGGGGGLGGCSCR